MFRACWFFTSNDRGNSFLAFGENIKSSPVWPELATITSLVLSSGKVAKIHFLTS